MNKPEQLILNLHLPRYATFANFYPGHNQSIITFLKGWVKGQNENMIYLWGPPGVGKTHLLQACCHFANERTFTNLYLPLREHPAFTPAILDNLERFAVVCVDDVDAIAGLPAWEEALLHLYNRILIKNGRLILTACYSPKETGIELADFSSRLQGSLALRVASLFDTAKIAALRLQASARGLILPHVVANFLIRHCPRNMSTLCALLDQLERVSLVKQRKLTIPFVKAVLEL